MNHPYFANRSVINLVADVLIFRGVIIKGNKNIGAVLHAANPKTGLLKPINLVGLSIVTI